MARIIKGKIHDFAVVDGVGGAAGEEGERCGAGSPKTVDENGRLLEGMNDYCAGCSQNLCDACMVEGCCGNIPAESGDALEEEAIGKAERGEDREEEESERARARAVLTMCPPWAVK